MKLLAVVSLYMALAMVSVNGYYWPGVGMMGVSPYMGGMGMYGMGMMGMGMGMGYNPYMMGLGGMGLGGFGLGGFGGIGMMNPYMTNPYMTNPYMMNQYMNPMLGGFGGDMVPDNNFANDLI